MTPDEIQEAIDILGRCYRQAALSNGSWRCLYWRQQTGEHSYPAPWYVDPAEYMAEKYNAARYTLLAMLNPWTRGY